jgi:hypothetical protein
MTSDQDVAARKAWSRPFIAKTPDSPAYGTPEWLALPHGPAKIAAVVRAAECWATDGDNLEARLRIELDAAAAEPGETARKEAEDAERVERQAAHRRAWIPSLPGFRRDPAIDASVEADWRSWSNGDDAA